MEKVVFSPGFLNIKKIVDYRLITLFNFVYVAEYPDSLVELLIA